MCTVEGCSISFKSKKLLVKHFKHSHPNLATSYSCSVCSKTFNDTSNYKRHIKTHRSQMEKDCPFCKKQFFKYSLPRHIKRYHGPIKIVSSIIEELVAMVCSGELSQRQTTPSIRHEQATTISLGYSSPNASDRDTPPPNINLGLSSPIHPLHDSGLIGRDAQIGREHQIGVGIAYQFDREILCIL